MSTYIWDLESRDTYVMVQGNSTNPIMPGRREVPQAEQMIRANGLGRIIGSTSTSLQYKHIDSVRLRRAVEGDEV